jgi:glyoxylase-like metal-dependent hydrolase (beta-lactamase superfamily II)
MSDGVEPGEDDTGADPEVDVDAPTVEPARFYGMQVDGEPFAVLDVRSRAEREAWPLDVGVEERHVPFSRFVTTQVTGDVAALVEGLAEPVVVVCPRGEASARAAAALAEAGVDAVNLAGGLREYARLLVGTDLAGVDVDGALVREYHRPASGCLSYLVVSGGEALVVDPLRAFADRYVADAAALDASLSAAVDTHVHADHVSGVREVAAAAGVEPVLPAGARDRGLAFDATLLADGDVLAAGDVELRAVAVPGHTSEATALRLGDLLLGGDLLFPRSVARPDLEVGDDGARAMARRLHATLRERVGPLADDVVVAPGHRGPGDRPGPDGTYAVRLGTLRERLAALSMEETAFVEHVLASMPPRPNEFERIVEANLGRLDVDDEAAFEMELGPNNCAATTAADA